MIAIKRVILALLSTLIVSLFLMGATACSSSSEANGAEEAYIELRTPVVGWDNTMQFMEIDYKGRWEITFSYAGDQSGWASVANNENKGRGAKTVMILYGKNLEEQQREVTIILRDNSGTELTLATLTQAKKGVVDPGVEPGIKLSSALVGADHTSQLVWIESSDSWTLGVVYEGTQSDWVELAEADKSGVGNKQITLRYSKNTLTEERKVSLVMKDQEGVEVDRVTMTQAKAGENPDPIPIGWLEMPEGRSMPNTKVVTHNAPLGGKSMRNYTMLYDTQEKLAYWVAYPHHKNFVTGSGRSNKWAYDPKFTQGEQVNLKKGITGYDRGHQIPSGDRPQSTNLLANQQTFFYTNMTPQLSRLNQDMWAGLENKIRGWLTSVSNLDTMYVVTGAILKTVGGNEVVKYADDNDKVKMAIPNFYYKVLLARKRDNTYSSIGFWYKHEPAKGTNFEPYLKSVRDIEVLTGFNFFWNLPKATQDKVETTFDRSDWPGL